MVKFRVWRVGKSITARAKMRGRVEEEGRGNWKGDGRRNKS